MEVPLPNVEMSLPREPPPQMKMSLPQIGDTAATGGGGGAPAAGATAATGGNGGAPAAGAAAVAASDSAAAGRSNVGGTTSTAGGGRGGAKPVGVGAEAGEVPFNMSNLLKNRLTSLALSSPPAIT